MQIEAERMRGFRQQIDLISAEDVTFYWKFYQHCGQALIYNSFFAETFLDFNLKTFMPHEFLGNSISEMPADENIFSAIKLPKNMLELESIFNALNSSDGFVVKQK